MVTITLQKNLLVDEERINRAVDELCENIDDVADGVDEGKDSGDSEANEPVEWRPLTFADDDLQAFTVRFETRLLDTIQTLAQDHGISRARVVRTLVKRGLSTL